MELLDLVLLGDVCKLLQEPLQITTEGGRERVKGCLVNGGYLG
jgi:hypothetical protein